MEATGVQWGQDSRAALDTAAKIMVDVAHDHMENIAGVDALPLCCAYNLRVAMKHITDVRSPIAGEDSSDGLESLLALEKAFCKRWRSAAVQQEPAG
jgi:hypothetical protein